MAKVYGKCGAEKKLIRICGKNNINCFDDVVILQDELKQNLDSERKLFFDSLPNKINTEKKKLKLIEQKKESEQKYFQKKIKKIREKIKEKKEFIWTIIIVMLSSIVIVFKKTFQFKKIRKKIKDDKKLLFNKKFQYKYIFIILFICFILPFIDIFIILFNYLKLRKVSLEKKHKINEIKEKIEEKKEELNRLENKSEEIFEEENRDSIEEIKEYDEIKSLPDYLGASGELKILSELKKLDDSYHILCDVYLKSHKWLMYNDAWNLQSAQIDFVVVSHKGIFVIEVKNWSSKYKESHKGLSPYEQVDRAGYLMYKLLQDDLPSEQVDRVTKILVNVRSNWKYDRRWKYVMVKNIFSLNRFIQQDRDKLDSYEVKTIVNYLKNYRLVA